jgi:hypothetical protein
MQTIVCIQFKVNRYLASCLPKLSTRTLEIRTDVELIESKIVKVESKISSKDVVRAYDLVVDRRLEFLEKWEEIHGKQDES